jgi:hypothetical protein
MDLLEKMWDFSDIRLVIYLQATAAVKKNSQKLAAKEPLHARESGTVRLSRRTDRLS